MVSTANASATGATYTLFAQTDMTNPDFQAFMQGIDNYALSNNVTFSAITYPNALELDSKVGATSEADIFYGAGYQFSLNGFTPTISGGTIEAILTETLNGSVGTPTSAITGLDISAASLYQALEQVLANPTAANEAAVMHLLFQGNDTIVGSQFNDVLYGYGPNETFIPGATSSDQITGTSGINTVDFSGALSQYTVTGANNAVTVVNNGNGATDTLTNIQQVKFSDYTLVFDLHSSQDTLVYELYQAAYDRTPDLAGFRYWAGVADANNTSALALADAFIAAPEFTAKYGANPSNTAYVTELYTDVLGRAPDQNGLNYWINQANAGQPRDQLLVDFATSPENVNLIALHIAHGFWTV